MRVVAGIDGCPTGWLCVAKNMHTGTIQACILERISAVLELEPPPELVMVDMPIGLTDTGRRLCDQEARTYLKPTRASSVFSAPIRPMLSATTYEEACQIGRTIDGRALSKQTWGIVPKIKEVDTFLRADTSRNQWIREVHPELCFRAWNKDRPMQHRKKSEEGKAERELLVNSAYSAGYAAAKSSLPRGKYNSDDLLDAFSALWTAERVVAGRQTLLPATPPVDSFGLRMEIVA